MSERRECASKRHAASRTPPRPLASRLPRRRTRRLVRREPRTAYLRLLYRRVPWLGRDEDSTDEGIWAVTCFVTRVGFRHQGISRALAAATVDFARSGGSRPRGIPHDHAARQRDHVGRTARRQSQHLRSRGLHRGEQADPAARRDARGVLGELLGDWPQSARVPDRSAANLLGLRALSWPAASTARTR